jgi:predicted phosphohydrolase
MRVFAIGDLHLEGGSGKTMDRFGENWIGHDRKIFDAWERIGRDDDLLILAGDITWATKLQQAVPDLERIGRMKGQKVMIKGNHDYWWDSGKKLAQVLHPSVKPLQNEFFVTGEVAVAGTRGWVCPNDTWFHEQDEKIYTREVGRLRLALESLKQSGESYRFLLVALHYPPANDKQEPSGFTELMDEYSVDACVYGHLHGESIKNGLAGRHSGTMYYQVSADNVDFAPVEIAISDAPSGCIGLKG